MKDAMTMEGAMKLARQIEAYWAEKGQRVVTNIIVDNGTKEGHGVYCIRSDMVDGLPTKEYRKAA